MLETHSLRPFASIAFAASLVFTGACKDDVGQCCEVLPGGDESLIPQPEQRDDGTFIDNIKLNSGFDCESFVCVSYKGSRAFCTQECAFDDACPDGFRCEPVLESAPCDYQNETPDESDDCPPGTITPEDKFCVRDNHQCDAEQ